ncbi:hypothetical protein BKA04_001307 [Cryobacterium mesophilum]|uniref:Uncharacterized protein n=1 Tax=Terrimesophilobacter mesophilus TaxID=433647 RepID=A0A4R8VCL9_9MICO|nr:hypothetical protein [Terrimesophilobacter mesophilus]MBB5633084.1 hypothetical protein [Terrimesophilobacter mesophilus]TFB79842.1 hypothetical protein E3N84_07175 [Terrimesophilobacter mesophilus]
MEANDPLTTECLRQLLEQQGAGLRRIAARLDGARHRSRRETAPVSWSGRARDAHDALAERMQQALTGARDALELAEHCSARAAATLAGRVG